MRRVCFITVHSPTPYLRLSSRPFLFRTTSYDVLKEFRAAPHIHADALSQDAWDRGVIRSDTDYSVYSAPRTPNNFRLTSDNVTTNTSSHGYQGLGGGMQGADVAFYHARSRYHTMDDTIRGMGYDGAQRSLWALMELLRTVGNSILNNQSESGADEKEKAVYFERRIALVYHWWNLTHAYTVPSIRGVSCRLPLPHVANSRDGARCYRTHPLPPRRRPTTPRICFSSFSRYPYSS
jgi:hypothetical protein